MFVVFAIVKLTNFFIVFMYYVHTKWWVVTTIATSLLKVEEVSKLEWKVNNPLYPHFLHFYTKVFLLFLCCVLCASIHFGNLWWCLQLLFKASYTTTKCVLVQYGFHEILSEFGHFYLVKLFNLLVNGDQLLWTMNCFISH